jgi:lipopolysaccharide transport system permease protein
MQKFQKPFVPDQPPTLLQKVIEAPHGLLSLRLREIWQYRELLFFFVWRDIKVRYKQTVLGISWAILHPVITMVIFSIIFGRLGKFSSGDIPYPVFSYAGLLPWQLFSRTISDATSSLITNQSMITKIYFPRIILPISSGLSGLVDFGIAMIVFFGLMIFYHIPFTLRLFLLPLLVVFALVTAMSISFWLSALAVRYRDIKFVTPFLVQVWLYATPVIYSVDLIPEQWRWILSLNPMTAVVDGFRWVLYGQMPANSPLLLLSVGLVLLLFFTGLLFFQRMQYTFADQL